MAECLHYDFSQELSHCQEKIRQCGGRVTQQKTLLLCCFLNFRQPFCADDLIESTKNKAIDPSTIYRFLQECLKLGLIESIPSADNSARYEYRPDTHHHHHHVVCLSCKEISPLTHCNLKAQEDLLRKMGYRQIQHKLEFYALCANCSN